MSLPTGKRLGPYEIVAAIGAGGMGEVYRARDTRLHRDVAIKVCSAEFSERFEREARTVAALNHPHICTLHDVGPDYLVMELLEGPTLADRIHAGPIPMAEALVIARQIAEALEAAHEKGIVHRDLKPANIKLSAEDNVKVLDFGLAKAMEAERPADPMSSPTVTLAPTGFGMILGTAGYMSPEQARGLPIDKRADIWSFGVVVYEILTGLRTFSGETVSDTLAAVLRADLDWTALPADTPSPIRRLLRRCLERDRKKRLRDIGDAIMEIDEALAQPAPEAAPASGAPARQRLWWAIGSGLMVLVAGVALWGWLRSPAPAPRPVMRWTTTLPRAGPYPAVTLSADGSHLAYLGSTPAATQQIFVRDMDQFESKPVTGTASQFPTANGAPWFSPDARWILYFDPAERKLKKISVSGGASITLCSTQNFHGATWGADDTIIFGDQWGGLSRIPSGGGEPKALIAPDPKKGEIVYAWPEILPGGATVLFSVGTGASFDTARITALNLRTGEKRTLLEGGANARYSPTGHLIYARAGALFGVPFDPERLLLKGSPVPILEGVAWVSNTGMANYSFAASGTLVYVPAGGLGENRTMVWVDRKGVVEAVPAPPQGYSNPSISPDGRQIAVGIPGPTQSPWDIWTYDLTRDALQRVTFGQDNSSPAWTPDGKRITFRSVIAPGKSGISWIPVDRSGPAEPLLISDLPVTPGAWTPDGNSLVFSQGGPAATAIWVLPRPAGTTGTAQNKPRHLVGPVAVVPQLSPDGHWLAYQSSESGVFQVYAQPFPGPGGKSQISIDGGHSPRWARNGRELFYRNDDKIIAVEIETKPFFRAGKPKVLFEGRYEGTTLGRQPAPGYDVAPNGKFLMIRGAVEQASSVQLQVVQDWFEELKRRVPSGK